METNQQPISSGFGAQTTAEEVVAGIDLTGKTIVITGGHAGLGLETTRVLANAGARVMVAARDMAKAKTRLDEMKNVELLPLDLSDPESIDCFAEKFLAIHQRIDVLINNAGVMAIPFAKDRRGYELQFATNHLGHFQLSTRLAPALQRAKSSRVVNLSSFGHRYSGVDLDDPNFEHRPYEKWAAYGQSKTANVLFTVELDRQGQDHGIRAFAVHPGRILDTELIRHLTEEDLKRAGVTIEDGVIKSEIAFKTIEQGAATTVWCAVSPQLNGYGGVYCADCDISPITPNDSQDSAGIREYAINKTMARALWELSEEMTG